MLTFAFGSHTLWTNVNFCILMPFGVWMLGLINFYTINMTGAFAKYASTMYVFN